MKKIIIIAVLTASIFLISACSSADLSKEQKDASKYTKEYNDSVANEMNKDSIAHENELAAKGLIATTKNLQIKHSTRDMLSWDMTKYDFLKGEAPGTVNPKLWEHAKINMNVGLYKVEMEFIRLEAMI
ncbi:MAG: hypothetical protein ACRCUS_00795 [Anaerovoracaceae bacterium]